MVMMYMQDVMEKSRRAHFLFDDDDQTPKHKQNGPMNDGSGGLCVRWCYGVGKSSSTAKDDDYAAGRPAAGSNRPTGSMANSN